MSPGVSRPVIQKNVDAQWQQTGSHLSLEIPFIPIFMGFKPLELELNSWWKLQNSGFNLQKLHGLILLCILLLKKKANSKGKIPTCCAEWP
jgi:hypothetical protein